MLKIMGIWIFLIAYVIGIGLYFIPLLKPFDFSNRLFYAFWCGFFACLLLLQVFHLWMPIDSTLFYGFLVLSVGGYVFGIKGLCDFEPLGIRNLSQRAGCCLIGLVMFWLVWLSNRALSPNFIDDTGLYHFSAVMWAKEYSIVPGLGNLHGRLAFNNTHLLFNALLDGGFWSTPSVRIGNGFLILCMGIMVSWSTVKVFSEKTLTVLDGFRALMFLVVFYLAVNGLGLSTDIPNFILGFLVTGLFVEVFLQETLDKEDVYHRILLMGLFTAVAITVKISFLVFGCALLGCALFRFYYKFGQDAFKLCLSKKTGYALLLAFSIVGLFIVRGYILSGYPVYPSSFGAIGADWTIPVKDVIWEMRGIKASARIVGPPVDEILGSWMWLGHWLQYSLFGIKGIWIIVMPSAIGILGCLSLIYKNQTGQIGFKVQSMFLFILPFVTGAAFWFITAPDPRFVGVLFWALGLGLLIASESINMIRCRLLSSLMMFGFVIVFIIGANIKPNGVVTQKGPNGGLWPLPKPKTEVYTTQSGLKVNVAIEKGAMQSLTWDVPLPSAPGTVPNVSLREKGNMQKGFKKVYEP